MVSRELFFRVLEGLVAPCEGSWSTWWLSGGHFGVLGLILGALGGPRGTLWEAFGCHFGCFGGALEHKV